MADRAPEIGMNDATIASIIFVVFIFIFGVSILYLLFDNEEESSSSGKSPPELSQNKKKLESSYFDGYKNISGNIQSLNILWGNKMLGLIAIWGFFNFIYLKIATEAFLDEGMSIIAAFLISVIFSATIFVVSAKYAFKLFYINGVDTPPLVSLFEIIQRTILSFILFSIAYMAVSRGIVFGFSKRLNNEISSSYDGTEMSVYLFAILLIPLLIHYAMSIFPTYYNSNEGLYDIAKELKKRVDYVTQTYGSLKEFELNECISSDEGLELSEHNRSFSFTDMPDFDYAFIFDKTLGGNIESKPSLLVSGKKDSEYRGFYISYRLCEAKDSYTYKTTKRARKLAKIMQDKFKYCKI